MHRWIIGPGAAVVVAGATALLAPTAQAAVTATSTCAAPVNLYFTLAPGETFTLTVSGACTGLSPGEANTVPTTYGTTGTEAVLPPRAWQSVTPTVTAIYTARTCGPTITESLFTTSNIWTQANLGGYGLTTIAADCPSGPADVLQQVSPGADGTCSAIDASSLNIGGAGSGGWGRSWAQWVNDGRGGAVCTRTLTYSDDLGHYVVAS